MDISHHQPKENHDEEEPIRLSSMASARAIDTEFAFRMEQVNGACG